MMEMQPLAVASTTRSIRLLVPWAKLSHSNTPTGPFHTICLARPTASAKALELSGPQSRPWSGEGRGGGGGREDEGEEGGRERV